MKEQIKKIKYERCFEGLAGYKKPSKEKARRLPVHICPKCGKAYKRTMTLKEVEVVGD